MGLKTDEYLSSLFADSFKREVDADEAVWRSLPFFAAILGLAVAVLPSIYRSASAVTIPAWQMAVYGLLALSMLCFVTSGCWLWAVIKLRPYRYPPTDAKVLEYAAELQTFHASRKLSVEKRDDSVRDELREFMLREFALATTTNRRNNAAKARARSHVLLWIFAGFVFAFVAEATILAAQALSPTT
jgi:hypothetical protein